MAEKTANLNDFFGSKNLRPKLDINGCYDTEKYKGANIWSDLRQKTPNPLLDIPGKVFLFQSLIGRGLYGLQLSWYNSVFLKDNIHVVCSSELLDSPAQTTKDVGDYLGIDSTLDVWQTIVDVGMFNVHGKKGYDVSTDWGDKVVSVISEEEIAASSAIEKAKILMKSLVEYDKELLDSMKDSLLGGGYVGSKCKW